MNKKQLILSIFAVILLSGCSLAYLPDYIVGQDPISMNYAYRYDDKHQPKIKKGMSRQEVLDKWGKPSLITISSDKSKDEWYYTIALTEKGGIYELGKELHFELTFQNDILRHIIRQYHHADSKRSKDVEEEFDKLVDDRLKEAGLKIK